MAKRQSARSTPAMKPLCIAALLVLPALTCCNRDHKRVIAVIPKGNSDIFWQSVHAGAAKAAKEKDVDIIWNGPASETDYTAQLRIADTMINRHVDAMALAPIDRQAMVGVVERAAKENVPVIIYDSGIDTENYVSRIATDNYMTEQLSAAPVCETVHGPRKGASLSS